MENKKELIDKNLLISFIISVSFLTFIYFATNFDFGVRNSVEEGKKIVKELQTPYKLLYLAENSQNYAADYFTQIPKTSLNQDYEGIPFPSNLERVVSLNIVYQCNLDPQTNKLSIIRIPYFNTSNNLQENLEKLTITKSRRDLVPFIYDFVTKQRTQIDCSGSYQLESFLSYKSPDEKIVLDGDFRYQKEFSIYKGGFYGQNGVNNKEEGFVFPYFGEKNFNNSNTYDDDFSNQYQKILINQVVVNAKNEGYELNPFNKSEDKFLNNVTILGWVK